MHPMFRVTATAAALLLTTVACSDNSGDSVAIVGDSITTFDREAAQDDLGQDYELTISGNFGDTIEQVLPEAEFVGSTQQYDQVIVNIGSNDVIGDLDVATSMGNLETLLSNFEAAECIWFVNINEYMLNLESFEKRTAEAEEFNAALEDFVERDDRLSIIDWAAATESTLNDDEPPTSTLTKDSVHPTAEGNERLNELYRDALESC